MSEIPRGTLVKYISLVSIGTVIEWYDLFVVGVAASLVWPRIMFPPGDPAAALAASIGTYAAVYFTRPVGAIIFGHFGDKIGRKTMLIWTLILTAIGMAGMALTPTYAEIGILAPVLIALFRIIQGIGLGGEYGGAASLLIEYVAKGKKRAYYGSFLMATIPIGAFLSILGLFLTTTFMGQAGLVSIGWRILLGVGAVAVIAGGIIRYILLESPLFQEILKRREVVRAPVAELFRKQWKTVILLIFSWPYTVTLFSLVYFPTGLSYMAALGIPGFVIYPSLLIGAVGGIIGTIVGGYLGEIIGRRYVMMIGAILCGIFAYTYYLLVPTKVFALVALANALVNFALFFGASVVPAFFSEHFPTKYRYSGVGVSYQFGGFINGIYTSGFLPLAIVAAGGIVNAPFYIIIMVISLVIIAIIALILLKETKNIDLTALDMESVAKEQKSRE